MIYDKKPDIKLISGFFRFLRHNIMPRKFYDISRGTRERWKPNTS